MKVHEDFTEPPVDSNGPLPGFVAIKIGRYVLKVSRFLKVRNSV